MPESRPSLESALDVLVYAPVGLAAEVRRLLPDLAREGRTRVEQRVTLARFVGRLAVRAGRQQLESRLAAVRAAAPVPRPAGSAPAATPAAAAAAGSAGSRTVSGEEPPREEAPTEVAVRSQDLPIVGYDTLSASQVVSRLAALDGRELDVVEAYERANRQRRTILGKVEQLRARVA